MQLAHGALEARHRPDLLGSQIIHRRRVEGGCERVALERAVAKVVGRAEDQRGLGVSQPIVLEEVGRARARLLRVTARVRVRVRDRVRARARVRAMRGLGLGRTCGCATLQFALGADQFHVPLARSQPLRLRVSHAGGLTCVWTTRLG